jgi:hypothetical protein
VDSSSSTTWHRREKRHYRQEIAEILTHAAFYVGWPKAWAAFRMAKEVWAGEGADNSGKAQHQREMAFPIGAPNDGFARYFVGRSYLQPLSASQVGAYNVTFEPGCRNNWHIHHARRAAVRSFCAWPAGAGIRSGARRPGRCARETWSISRRR